MHNKENTPIIVEILLSLFGIYGVGWLRTRTVVGIVLLFGSVFYWVMTIGFVSITWGLGIFCIAPFNIILVLINAAVLYTTRKSQARRMRLTRGWSPQAYFSSEEQRDEEI